MKSTLMTFGLLACLTAIAGVEADFARALNAGAQKMKVRSPDFMAAREDFSKALGLARNDTQTAQAARGIADTYYMGREYEEARAEDAKISAMKGSTSKQKVDAQLRIADSFMGYRFQEVPDYARARVEYRKVLSIADATPDDRARAVLGIGGAFATERKYAEARAEYAQAVNMKNVSPELRAEAQYNIGSGYRAEGKFDKAKAEYAKILEMADTTAEYRGKVEQRIRAIYR